MRSHVGNLTLIYHASRSGFVGPRGGYGRCRLTRLLLRWHRLLQGSVRTKLIIKKEDLSQIPFQTPALTTLHWDLGVFFGDPFQLPRWPH